MGYTGSDGLADDCTLAEIFWRYLHCNVLMIGFVSHNPFLLTAFCNYVFINECSHIYSE